jgi:hypothetical protein
VESYAARGWRRSVLTPPARWEVARAAGLGEAVGRSRRGHAGAPTYLPSATGDTRERHINIHDDETRQIVHIRPVDTVHCHPVTD